MSLYLGSSIISARLSNEVPGLITGSLTVAGLRDPLSVELRGNFLRDIAGCTVELRNPIPDADSRVVALLADHQVGEAGEMTASRRITQMLRKARPPKGYPVEFSRSALKNLLFLEWFNEQQQRIVIQSWHWNVSIISGPSWIMPKEMEPAIIKENRARRKTFLLEENRPRNERKPATTEKTPSTDAQTETAESPMTLRELLAEHARQSSHTAAHNDPLCAQAAQLSAELMVLEGLLSNPDGVRSRPTLAGLLQSIADLCGQLAQTMGQFTTLPRGQWAFLITDVEQSMMLLSAAVNVCDAALKEHEADINRTWLDDAHRQIARLQSEIANFLRALTN